MCSAFHLIKLYGFCASPGVDLTRYGYNSKEIMVKPAKQTGRKNYGLPIFLDEIWVDLPRYGCIFDERGLDLTI